MTGDDDRRRATSDEPAASVESGASDASKARDFVMGMQAESERRAGMKNATWPAAAWGWLYPATYAIHILEEWRGGEGFTVWLARVSGVELAAGKFLVWNALALLSMSVGVVLAMRFKNLRWLLLAYGTAFLLNALSHLAASLYTISYSPGLVSSLLLWLPLAALTHIHFKPALSRRATRAGLAVGVLMHCVVIWLTLAGQRSGI